MRYLFKAVARAALLTSALAAAAFATDRFRIMFLYTANVASQLGGMHRAADSLINELNDVYYNSGLDIVAENAGVFKTSLPPADIFYPAISYIPSGVNALWARTYRTQYSADLVVLLGNSATGACGGNACTYAESTWAYAGVNTRSSCAHTYPFPTYVGQFFGSYAPPTLLDPAVFYARGTCSNGQGWRTIGPGLPPGMTCGNTYYVPYYSNPSIYFPSSPPPDSMGIVDTADMARAIQATIPTVRDIMTAPSVLTLTSAITGGGSYTRTGSAVQSNEFIDAVAQDSIDVGSGFTIDAGGSARFRSNGTIRVSNAVIHAGSGGSVVFRSGGGQVFGKMAAREDKPRDLPAAHAVETGFRRAVLKQGLLQIDYELAKGVPVQAEVFGIDGKSLGRWNWSDAQAGSHSRVLQFSRIPGGVLFVKWRAGAVQSTRRILVMN